MPESSTLNGIPVLPTRPLDGQVLAYEAVSSSLRYSTPAPGSGAAWGTITGTLASQTDLQAALDAKQATLVSATNIKTINGSSVLGAGDLVVTGAAPDIALSKMAPSANQTITAACSAYVSMFYETVSTFTLELGAGACLEVG